MSINNIRAVGDDRQWKDEVERELKTLLNIIKYGKISLRSNTTATGSGGGGGNPGADLISATLPATYDNTTYVVGVDQDAFDHLSNLSYLQFDTATATPSDIGRMVWNDTLGTLEFELKGGNVAMPIGQSNVQRVRNATAGTLTKGTVVYINGSNGTNFNVEKALASGDSTSAQTLGVLAEELDTSSTQHGFVTTFGLVSGIDISYITGLTEGDILYLDGTTAGQMTRVKPQAPTHLVYVAYCLSANGGGTNSTIFVKPQNGYELDEIHDVKITTPIANNEVLAYTLSTSLWENKTGPEAGLITTSDTGTVTNTMLAGSIDNGKLSNSAVTVNGTSISLGASGTVTAAPSGTAGGKLSGTYPNPGLNAGLDDLSDVVISGPATDEVLKYVTGTGWINAAAPGGGGGTVTSITAGTGLATTTGFPITTSGTISLADRTVSDKSANYTIVSTDQNKIIRSTGSAITITLANVLSAGQSIQFIQAGTGAIAFEAGSGVTLTSTKSGSRFLSAAQYAVVSVICAASGVYYITGDIIPFSIPFQFLLIAGGGSGGASSAGGTQTGGGAAGGMFEATTGDYFFTPAQSYSLVIGGGGAGVSTGGNPGSTGTNSTIEFHTAIGDTGAKTTKTVYGGGRGGETSNGGAGGSGGGGGVTGTSSSTGGTVTTAGEGNVGGAGSNTTGKAGGGGGGAGTAGAAGNGTTSVGGNGGNGKASVITGTTYAGGGGGTANTTLGTGGTGGGTNATDNSANGTPVAANTGSGSGAKKVGSGTYFSGNGGSGVAAIKYPDTYPALTITPSGSATGGSPVGGYRTYIFTASATIGVS